MIFGPHANSVLVSVSIQDRDQKLTIHDQKTRIQLQADQAAAFPLALGSAPWEKKLCDFVSL